MRIVTRIVIDMNTMDVLERDSYDYSGPIAMCKGDQTAQNTEQSQGNFVTQLQNTFKTNYAAQQNQLNFLNTKLQAAINNPQGFSPQTLAAMRAQANDEVAAENQNVERNVNNMEETRGGPDALPSGVNTQINAAVSAEAAQKGNAAQQNITEQNAVLENENLWKATQAEEGVAGLENPEGMASAENTGASEVAGLSNAVTTSSGPTAGSIIGSVLGGGSAGVLAGVGLKAAGG